MNPSAGHPRLPSSRPPSPSAKRPRCSALAEGGASGDVVVASAGACGGRAAQPVDTDESGVEAVEIEVVEIEDGQMTCADLGRTDSATSVADGIVVSLLDDPRVVKEPQIFPLLPSSISSRRRPVPVPKAIASPPSVSLSKKEIRLLPPSPQAQFTYVKTKAALAPALNSLSLCNVFTLDVKSKHVNLKVLDLGTQSIRHTHTNLWKKVVVIDGVARSNPSLLFIVGTRLDNLRPEPGPIFIDVEDAHASEMVYVFDLMALLPCHGAALDAGLAPLFADPEKLILGLDIESELQLLARVYADCVPCFGRTVHCIKDIGSRCTRETSNTPSKASKLVHLTAQFTGCQVIGSYAYNWALRPVGKMFISGGASGVLGLLNVYRNAGSEALGGTERTLELGTANVLKCCTCGAICFDGQVSAQCDDDCFCAPKHTEASKMSIRDERLRVLELQNLQPMVAEAAEKGKEQKEIREKKKAEAKKHPPANQPKKPLPARKARKAKARQRAGGPADLKPKIEKESPV